MLPAFPRAEYNISECSLQADWHDAGGISKARPTFAPPEAVSAVLGVLQVKIGLGPPPAGPLVPWPRKGPSGGWRGAGNPQATRDQRPACRCRGNRLQAL